MTLAVAGFSREDLSIETRENTLTIKGAKEQTTETGGGAPAQRIDAKAA